MLETSFFMLRLLLIRLIYEKEINIESVYQSNIVKALLLSIQKIFSDTVQNILFRIIK